MHAGEQTWYGDAGKEPGCKQRRLKVMKAVQGDDLSAVIHFQTQHTIEGKLVDLLCLLVLCDTHVHVVA